jgi:biotin carboxylase
MSNPWLVFVESNTSGTGRLFAKIASDCGYRPVLLAERPERYPYLKADSVQYLKCDSSSSESLYNAMQGLTQEAPVAGVFSSSEYFIEMAATLAELCGLSGADPVALRTCRNKWLQRQRLQAAGFNTPKFECVTSCEKAGEALRHIPLPVIVKPTMGTGSVGVRLCRTTNEVMDHAAVLLNRTVNERGMPILPEVLIEEYVVGLEYSVEVFGGVAVGITKKHVSAEPFFVELGHDFPAPLSGALRESIGTVVHDAVRSLGLMWGPAHVELRLAAEGPTIIEINPRLAGGFIPEIVRIACGIDLVKETVRLVAGEDPRIVPDPKAHASIRFVEVPGAGTIKGIEGVGEAVAIEGVVDAQIYKNVGDWVQRENDFRDRIGHVIASTDSEVQAAALAELACSRIRVQLRHDG